LGAVEACSTLTVVWDRLLAATGLACLERLSEAERAQVASRSRALLYREALRVADATARDRWGSGLSAQDRVPQVLAGLAGIRDCELRVQKLRQHAVIDALTSGQTGLVVSSLYSCARHPAAASLALELLAMAPPEELATVFHALSIRVVGRLPDYSAPLSQVIAVLVKRQAEAPQDPELLDLLDQAYEDLGADDQRITLLRSRLEPGGPGLRPAQWQDLIELLLAAGRTEEALSWLAQAPTESSDLEQLRGETLLSLGRVTEAREHAEALIEDTESTSLRALGLELLAAVRAREGDLPAALASLEGSVATGAASPTAKAIHYSQRLEQGDDGAVFSALTAECSRTVVESRGITLCVAARLADLGAFDRLRELLEPFVSAPVADLEQLEEAVQLSRTAGFSDLARALLDRLLRLDSSSPERWQALAEFLRAEGDLETLADLAGQADGHLPAAAFGIRWQLAKGYLAARRSREAVALLLSLREQTAQPEWIDEDLRHAYRMLGEEP
jgi:tetratricopeptide (TPR) repeat protein